MPNKSCAGHSGVVRDIKVLPLFVNAQELSSERQRHTQRHRERLGDREIQTETET